MNHEISELDIPDRQLLASNTRPNIWTEIGEAQITHTIFGRAKVRIVRKKDNRRLIFWVLGVAVLAIAGVAWQGLFTSQQPEEVQSTDQAAVSTKEPVRAADTQSEKIASPETPTGTVKELGAPIHAEVDKPVVPKNKPHQAEEPKLPEPKLANQEMPRPKPTQPKPILAKPRPVITEQRVAEKPQVVPYAGSQAAKAPASTVPSVNSISQKPSGAAAVAVIKPGVTIAASSPAAVMEFSDPLQKPADSTVDSPPPVPGSAPNK